jgi:3-oxoacyl-[acyl-carrier protein] reductase
VIGKAVVNLFASDETNVIAATSRTGERMQDESRQNIHVYPLDFSDMERARIQIATITRSELRLDAIVVATGILRTSFSLVADNETEQIQINFLRVIEVLKVLIRKYLTRDLKSIVLIASTSATNSDGGRLGYSSSKAALIAAGKTLARELGPKGVRVNSVSPGLIDSEMVDSTIDHQQLNTLKARLFLERLGSAEEVAKVIQFLASNDSSYITGQNILIDGGMSW